MPRQIPFIIANEGCERFSFYGMRNILTVFLTTSLLRYLPEAQRGDAAKEVFHSFVMGVYFFPLLGGWIADRFFGKYPTILWFSLIYCAGQGCLALFVDDRTGFYVGLGLIALGSGGIKPLVASFVGDQFDSKTKHLAKVVFDGFYWIINFGSFFASLLMPQFLKQLGPRVAFGIPGALMLVSTIVLVIGKRRYVMIPPAPPDPHSFSRVVRTALGKGGAGTWLALVGVAAGAASFLLIDQLDIVAVICLALVLVLGFGGAGTWMQLERARGEHPDHAVDAVRAVLRVLVAFAMVTPFFSLFDQKASTWVLQADAMSKPSWFESSQMQALNPALRRSGWEPTPLRRMTAGIAFAGVAWIVVGIMQLVIDGGAAISITWQILPYAFLTLGEVLVSATGLEFAYSQAPPSMKGVIMSFWNLVVTVGNLWVLLANASVKRPSVSAAVAKTGISVTAFQMFFFAAFALCAAAAFGAYARRYRMADHYRAG